VGVRVHRLRAGAGHGVRTRGTADRGPGRRSAAEPGRAARAGPGAGPGRGGGADDHLRRVPVQLRAAPAGRAGRQRAARGPDLRAVRGGVRGVRVLLAAAAGSLASPDGPAGLPGGGGRLSGRGGRAALGRFGRGAAAGGADRHRRRAGPRVQPAGHVHPGPGAPAARGGRQRAADHDHPARAGGRGGDVRQPVPDPGHGPGRHLRGLRARAGHHDELAGRGYAAGRRGRDPAGPDRGGGASLRERGTVSPFPGRRSGARG